MNTLANLDELKQRLSETKTLLDALRSVVARKKIADNSPLKLITFASVAEDVKKLSEEITRLELVIIKDEQEWELADAHLDVYKIEAHTVFRKLTAESLPDHLSYNTLKNLSNIRADAAEYCKQLYKLQEELKEHHLDNDVIGIDPTGYNIQSSIEKTKQQMLKSQQISERANREWEQVRAKVRASNMTAQDYIEIIKQIPKK